MTWLTRMLTETCTYWGPPLRNAYGDATYPSPATLSCHWEEKAQVFVDRMGIQTHSRAIVLLADEVEENGKLFYGESSVHNPDDVVGADPIRAVERVKTIRGNVTQWRALL